MAELQCTGLYRAGYHPGCCLWGVGSGLHWHHQTRADRGTPERQKNCGKERAKREGGRLHLKRNIIRVRRKGGWWREKGEDNGERSRMVQVDSLLRCFFFSPSFLLTIHPFTYLFSVMCIYSHYFNSVCVCVWLQCLFHSTFDISLVARARGGRICGPRWMNLTIWPSLHASFFFAFDEVWMHLLPYKMT